MKIVTNWRKYKENKPGTVQVGFISKAQKYSRNNNWKNLEKKFEKKYLVKKVAYCRKNPKRDPLGLLNVFYKPKTSKNSKGCPLIEFKNSRKMSHSAKKP